MSLLTDGDVADYVSFVASMTGIGGLVAATLAWFFRLLDQWMHTDRSVNLGDWTVYGGALGGWLGVAAVILSAVVG